MRLPCLPTTELDFHASRLLREFVRLVLISFLTNGASNADDKFETAIRPFLSKYCIDCHQGETPDGKLNLSDFGPASISDQFGMWKEIERRVANQSMPPKEAPQRPTSDEQKSFTALASSVRRDEAIRLSGDPGIVSVRRLSNAEYNNTLRDLTGVDLRPAREFPVDPANEAGFDNSAESLSMSSALLNKYLAASRLVASHLVLTPTGIAFASHPATTDTDRDKYCVQRIVDFYYQQPTDIADYLYVAWKAKVARDSGRSMSLEQLAKLHRVSEKYLAAVDVFLNDANPIASELGPNIVIRDRWRALLKQNENAVRSECLALRDYIVDVRRSLEPKFNLRLKGIHDGAQAFVLWKNRQAAEHRQSFVPNTLDAIDFDKLSKEVAHVLKPPAESTLRDELHRELGLFCKMFPDAFYVSERGRDYLGVPKDKQEKGRLLSAGFHSMMGYFRDDQPLYDWILDTNGRAQLDKLWQELDFVTAAPIRQYQGFLWFERTDHNFLRNAEFDFARPENKEACSAELISKLSELYLAKAQRMDAKEEHLKAIAEFFSHINSQIRWVEQTRRSSEAIHLDAIERFAERAFRGALTSQHRDKIRQFYSSLRQVENLSHEEAIQDLLVSVLMSPEFCYRIDLKSETAERRPLSDLSLANRLSYFLWASMPDEQLLTLAKDGQLHEPNVLANEVDRMLRDNRIRGLATEFGSQWLDFQRFQSHNSVDRVRFPQFTDALREAMYQEPILFLTDLIQQNRSVHNCLDADYTFLNSELASHYGLPDESEGDKTRWWRASELPNSQRGGLLPMAVFMTQNSPGLRTSPVKRGYWVVRRLLGEKVPPPPPGVPELPVDESQLGERTLRQTLEQHRQLESCAVCHDRLDSIGLAFESYGPVGEHRNRDLGERNIDASAIFPNGQSGNGIDGLRKYIKSDRQPDFCENLCRKLLAYGLSRTLRLSDELLIEKMQSNLAGEGSRFGSIIKTIVLSPQFLEKRGTSDKGTQNVE
jgi:Protein of unknown function (DUF1592)/Protein of unknown function (DUF1588)/Protein of unknown function (DUF1587)/Protein of unknown function (DUF1585)/Protein of unknown function (DUF1595)